MNGTQWYAVVRTADHDLVSVGTVVSAHPPPGCSFVPLDHEPDWGVERWNPALLLLEPRPADPAPNDDRITNFEADPEIQALPAADRQVIHDRLLRYFGDARKL